MRMACDIGHKELVKFMISSQGIRDGEGPDGMPALVLAIGHLDSDIVELLATPEVSDASPELLCDIMGQLGKAIATKESTSSRNKMAKLRAVIMECKIHQGGNSIENPLGKVPF